ncbi:hypothetical protein EYY60_11765 [Flavobacterium zhairuonense]|uniref:hypothetical protein n=1 Tax=Flavobacterium zhairuonense TaxID=2493631 RepID=UPI00104FD63A|nr:hypothetical protein [Flavobacterium zhairuonense]KAF2510180.1 hypothetical protein EYY60_11765 [Flavobacterium zhairuonense]
MKKSSFYFLAIALPMLTSCSNDVVESSSKSENILPRTVKYTSAGSSVETSFAFTYNGNKIKSITGQNERTDYTYEGDFIVKEVKYNTQSGSDVKKEEYSYAYENNKLVSTTYSKNFTAKYPNGSYIERSVYAYNADGSAVMKTYYKDSEFFEAEKLGDIELERNIDKLTFVDGNLIKRVSTISMGSYVGFAGTATTEYLYEYDANSTPFKNILGFDLLMKDVFANNIVKTTKSSVLWDGSYLNSNSSNTEYVYNEKDYPVKVSEKLRTIEYIY